MSQPTPAELFDHAQTLANGIRERDAAIKELLAERDQLKATVARVKALAEKLIATGDVSIGGIWSDHNIEIGRDILATLDRSDLPAVREFVAGFDPRKEALPDGYLAAAAVKQHEDLLASIALYIKWRYVTKQLTTEQKDLFADALERNAFRVHGPDGQEPDHEMEGLPSYAPRWWRPTEVEQPEEST